MYKNIIFALTQNYKTEGSYHGGKKQFFGIRKEKDQNYIGQKRKEPIMKDLVWCT